jgi:tyrosine-specific transport protein
LLLFSLPQVQCAPSSKAVYGRRGQLFATASIPDTKSSSKLKTKEQKQQADSQSVLSAAALVGGNMVGAGILALPAVTSTPGFVPSAVAMVGVWGYCLITGLLTAEVACSSGALDGRATVQGMAQATLGSTAGKLVGGAFIASNYLLLMAYIAQGSTVVDAIPALHTDVCGSLFGDCVSSFHLMPLVFAAAAGSFSLWGPAKLVENTNNAMVAVILAAFGGLVALGAPAVDSSTLLGHANALALPAVLPTLLCALTFHNVVPVVSSQLRGDMSKIRAALTVGTAVPLCMYLIWDAVMLGQAPPSAAEIIAGATASAAALAGDAVGSVLLDSGGSSSGGGSSSSVMDALIAAFSFAALLTSFFGASQSLMKEMTAVAEQLSGASPLAPTATTTTPVQTTTATTTVQTTTSSSGVKVAASLAVLVPPTAAAVLCPGAFYTALDLAGSFGDPLLYGAVPALMAWRMHSAQSATSSSSSSSGKQAAAAQESVLPGGTASLAAVLGVAVCFVVGQLALKVHA